MQFMKTQRVLISACVLAALSCAACHDKPEAPEENKAYVLPDSLAKTIEFDTVKSTKVFNSLTLTGEVTFDEDRVVKIFPVVSGSVSDIKVVLGDYVKKGQVLAEVRSAEMAGYSNDYSTAESNV